MGRKAPLTVFVGVCERHTLEDDVLPEGRIRGWPTEIDFSKLGRRIEEMEDDLKSLVNDAGPTVSREGKLEGSTSGPRAKCVFWIDIIWAVWKAKGSKAVTSIEGQISDLHSAQAG